MDTVVTTCPIRNRRGPRLFYDCVYAWILGLELM